MSGLSCITLSKDEILRSVSLPKNLAKLHYRCRSKIRLSILLQIDPRMNDARIAHDLGKGVDEDGCCVARIDDKQISRACLVLRWISLGS